MSYNSFAGVSGTLEADVPLNEWGMYTITNEDHAFKLYKNDTLIDSVSKPAGVGGTASGDWRVGYFSNEATGEFLIDELRIYKFTLDATDVTTLYNTVPSNETVTLLFDETFGYSTSFDESACYNSLSPSILPFNADRKKIDNDWYCYLSNTSATVVGETSFQNLVANDKSYKINVSSPPTDASQALVWFNGGEPFDVSVNSRIRFICDGSLLSGDTYPYIFFGLNASSDSTRSYISLNNGGCNDTTNLPTDNCCEIQDVVGTDCSSGITHIETDFQSILDNCPEYHEGSFLNIGSIYLWLEKSSSQSQAFRFDEFRVYENAIGGNLLPSISSVTPTPDPQEPNATVTWSVIITDDDLGSAIWSSFDCEDDGSLESAWAKRGTSIEFNCTYTAEGNYTGVVYASDDAHYPTYNTSASDVVEILSEPAQPPQGGNCIGFVAPTCSGDCYFNDDFSYSNPVECNEWEGTANDVNPISGLFSIFNMPIGKQAIRIEGDTYSKGVIYQSQYQDYEIEFKIRLSDDSNVQFDVLDNDLDQYSAFLVFSNYNAVVYDPSSTTIMSMTPGDWYVFRIYIDLSLDAINWYVDDDLKYTGDFYDGATDSQRRFQIRWAGSQSDFDIDYFTINYGTLQANATVPVEQVDYVYDPNLFCAINWSTNSTTDRFKTEYCTARGYNTNYPLLSLCIPRACMADIGSFTFNWATQNIFKTIILVTAFILIAPLLVAMRRRL